jgi:hypothetical protein
MSLTNKDKAKSIKKKNDKKKKLEIKVQSEISEQFHTMMDDFHRMNVRDDYELDTQILQWQIEEMTDGKKNLRGKWDDSLPTFSPSGASSSDRDLFFKVIEAVEDDKVFEPYQKRWVRNGSAIHSAQQRDLLYIEKYLKDAPFEVLRTKEGKPAWERNTRTVKQFEHDGEKFQLYGMVDGVLWHKETKKRLGYDFKTKSTTVAAVGDFLLKAPQENNLIQMIAYSLLFDVDEYIIHYESLAKDGWTKGEEAKPDMKVFHVHITEEMKKDVLDKFARVSKYARERKIPPREKDNELFSKYKDLNEAIDQILAEGETLEQVPTKHDSMTEIKGLVE